MGRFLSNIKDTLLSGIIENMSIGLIRARLLNERYV
jgi:hypothetical protein